MGVLAEFVIFPSLSFFRNKPFASRLFRQAGHLKYRKNVRVEKIASNHEVLDLKFLTRGPMTIKRSLRKILGATKFSFVKYCALLTLFTENWDLRVPQWDLIKSIIFFLSTAEYYFINCRSLIFISSRAFKRRKIVLE